MYQDDWVKGVTHSRIPELNALDSCSKYQPKVSANCLNELSKPFTLYFQTRGKDCAVANEDPNIENLIKISESLF
ncbi:MAG: hypothetical protein IPM92_07980 [Saprospiraceae bacterium]|nr:hypothetical protein [Saprospiraceae bacterium]